MHCPDFHTAIAHATAALMKRGEEVDAGSWQGYKTEGKPDLVTLELMNLAIEVPVDRPVVWEQHPDEPHLIGYRDRKLSYPDELTPQLADEIQPNLPWADDHFAERVSRDPSNPGVEYRNWPWWRGQVMAYAGMGEMQGDEILTPPPEPKFDHTYQERFWPKQAGSDTWEFTDRHSLGRMKGIRYDYGDLDDIVNMLFANPFTRQATFPIFFPEDTGAVHGGRIPCTLHYHFLLRGNAPPRLHMWYPIRSCDLVRHFRDDVYLACKLLLWVIQELQEKELRSDSPQIWVDVRPGTLFFTAYSFHVHKGDLHHVRH